MLMRLEQFLEKNAIRTVRMLKFDGNLVTIGGHTNLEAHYENHLVRRWYNVLGRSRESGLYRFGNSVWIADYSALQESNVAYPNDMMECVLVYGDMRHSDLIAWHNRGGE